MSKSGSSLTQLQVAALYASLASALAPPDASAGGLPVYPGGDTSEEIELPFTPIPVDSDRDDGDDGDDGGDDPQDFGGPGSDGDPCAMSDDDAIDDNQ